MTREIAKNTYTIPNYSEDKSIDIGKDNLKSLRSGKGKIKFTGAYIHLAPICNFRCKGCFTHMEAINAKRLRLKDIKKIVKFVKSRGGRSITFAGAGEPTLDPEFDKIFDLIIKKNLQTVLFTNLTTLKNLKQAKKYLQAGPVIAKLYTLKPNKYNRLTRNKDAFKSAKNGLELLLAAKKDLESKGRKVTLAIDSYICKENFMDLPNLLRYCRQNGIIPYFEAFIELGQSRRTIKKLSLSEKELAELFLRLQRIDNEEFNIDTPINAWSRNYGQDACRKATHMFSVREDGYVYMCVCSLRKVGSIFDKKDPYVSLEDIFSVRNKGLLDYFVCDKCSKLVNPKYLKES